MSTETRSIPVVEAKASPCCAPSTSADRCCDPLPESKAPASITTALDDGGDVRAVVREKYGAVASGEPCGCGCCAGPEDAEGALAKLGYTTEQAAAIPEGANLGLGCGNPIAHAELKPGETVLDLGSGAGIDCFLAAREVGPSGRAIGVDMTPSMLARARALAGKLGTTNVEFRMGEIEHLPVADASVDAIISNCVVNLSPEKLQVFREALRVLRPGGRLVVSDLVLTRELTPELRRNAEPYAGCVAGASLEAEYLRLVREAGFDDVRVLERTGYDVGADKYPADSPEREAFSAVVSIKVRATKQP
jgi:SAM-dependent methyltransferase